VENEWKNCGKSNRIRNLQLISLRKKIIQMAISRDNNFTRGLSGSVGGGMVFRSWNGKTYISTSPSKPKKQSPIQKENRLKFKMATHFAKKMMSDPAKKEEYKKLAKKMKLPNAYTAAITEYMRKPEIREVELGAYSGKENQEIAVNVRKKGFEIEVVEVIISDEKGNLIEQGKAERGTIMDWTYKTTKTVDHYEMLKITIRARERTGNFVDKKLSLTKV
jgi:hypothetical protein